MKIRIYNDSIRLRLDRDEVDGVGQGRSVECSTSFAGGAEFRYRLITTDTDALGADFSDGCIEVRLPRSAAEHWASDETEVSIRGENEINGNALMLLVEKDFECLEPRSGENQSNRFINPKAASQD